MKKIFAVIVMTLTLSTFVYADSKNTNTPNMEASSSAVVSPTSVLGQIVDSQSYSPLNCAIVTINGAENKTIKRITSNNNGLFEINGLPAGSYKMTVSFPGCEDVSMNISVNGSVTDMGVIEIK